MHVLDVGPLGFGLLALHLPPRSRRGIEGLDLANELLQRRTERLGHDGRQRAVREEGLRVDVGVEGVICFGEWGARGFSNLDHFVGVEHDVAPVRDALRDEATSARGRDWREEDLWHHPRRIDDS